jgi:membrane protein DedA with SNARE-associated domain
MLEWIVRFIGSLGYWGVGALMAIENIVFPLPSELIMAFAGFLVNRGYMSLPGAVLAGTAGSVLGSLPVYYAACSFGEERLSRWIDRQRWWLRIRGSDIERANARFKRNGTRAVVIARMIPGVRALIALPSGFSRMNVARFTAANFAGTLLWCSGLALAGQQLGAHFFRIEHFIRPFLGVILAAAAVGVTVWFGRRDRRQAQRVSAAGGLPLRRKTDR